MCSECIAFAVECRKLCWSCLSAAESQILNGTVCIVILIFYIGNKMLWLREKYCISHQSLSQESIDWISLGL